MTLRASAVAAALITVALVFPAIAQEPAPEPEPEPLGPPTLVERVIEGNAGITTDTILAAVQSQVGQPYDRNQAAADARAIKALGWFVAVDFRVEPAPGGARLVFIVEEYDRLMGVEFDGNTVLMQEELQSVLVSKVGEVINERNLDKDMQNILQMYQDREYPIVDFSQLPTRRQVEGGSIIVYHLLEGVIEEIRIQNNTKTKDWVIRRELFTQVGQVLWLKLLRRDAQRLFAKDWFDNIDTRLLPGSEPGKVIVVLIVTERKTGFLAFGVSWTSLQGFVGTIDLSDSNFRGNGVRLLARGEFGGQDSFEFGYGTDWFGGGPTHLDASVYDRLIARQAFDAGGSFLFRENRQGATVSFSRPLKVDPFGPETRAFLSLRNDEVSASPIPGGTLPDVDFLDPFTIRSIGLGVQRDTRVPYPQYPVGGTFMTVQGEVSGFGGAPFNKVRIDWRRYIRVGKAHEDPWQTRVVAFRLIAGTITGDPPGLENFFLGGPDTLRGYDVFRFPGRNMAHLNFEYRHPIGSRISLVFFTDVGDAWAGPFAEAFGDPNFKLHVGYGIGLRFAVPGLGPIRIDQGFSVEKSQLYFSIGHAF